MATVNPGYKGIATIDGKQIRCSDFGCNQNQEVLFYNHTIGLNDTIPTNANTKGEAVGVIQTQQKFMRPSPISIEGGMSFPATKSLNNNINFEDIFDFAKYGNYFDIDYKHYCEGGRKFFNCRVNTFEFSVTAGDIVNIVLTVMGMDMEDSDSLVSYTDPEKMITWDGVSVDFEGDTGGVDLSDSIRSLSFNINNNITPIYTAIPNTSIGDIDSYKNFLPKDLRIGMQIVTGSLEIYVKDGRDFLDPLTGQGVLSVSCGSFNTDINAIFAPKQIPGAVGPVIIIVPFVGVDKAFGD